MCQVGCVSESPEGLLARMQVAGPWQEALKGPARGSEPAFAADVPADSYLVNARGADSTGGYGGRKPSWQQGRPVLQNSEAREAAIHPF